MLNRPLREIEKVCAQEIIKHFSASFKTKFEIIENYFLVKNTIGQYGVAYIYGNVDRLHVIFKEKNVRLFLNFKEAIANYENYYRSYSSINFVDVRIIK